MDVIDLQPAEREALYAALAHLSAADGRISDGETNELAELAEEMEVPDLRDRLVAAHRAHPHLDDLRKLVATVERVDARELIRTLLFDLAHADGDRGELENDVLDAVTKEWARD
jgi:uncharacterized tellurite resistance protein B-like protein